MQYRRTLRTLHLVPALAILAALATAFATAAQRAPWKPPYEILAAPADAAPYERRLAGKPSAVWTEGDVLHILHRSPASQVQVTGGIQQPMTRLAGTDLWLSRLRMPEWDRAFLSYAFFTSDFKPGDRVTFERWYGRRAPKPPARARELKGRIIEKTVRSESLQEDRRLTIYLPPNAPKERLPAFFLADGQGTDGFAKVLEPLILAKRVRPCAIVGVHSANAVPGEKPGEYRDRRGEEYLKRYAPTAFAKHMAFFAKEVPALVEREFGISPRREERAVIGFSNGGGFAFDAAWEHPEVFGHALPFSASHGLDKRDQPPAGPFPKFYFAAGELEYFSLGTRQFHEEASAWPAQSVIEIYKAGHDPELWQLAFGRFAPRVFPRR